MCYQYRFDDHWNALHVFIVLLISCLFLQSFRRSDLDIEVHDNHCACVHVMGVMWFGYNTIIIFPNGNGSVNINCFFRYFIMRGTRKKCNTKFVFSYHYRLWRIMSTFFISIRFCNIRFTKVNVTNVFKHRNWTSEDYFHWEKCIIKKFKIILCHLLYTYKSMRFS
jgi:hypothetical protein